MILPVLSSHATLTNPSYIVTCGVYHSEWRALQYQSAELQSKRLQAGQQLMSKMRMLREYDYLARITDDNVSDYFDCEQHQLALQSIRDLFSHPPQQRDISTAIHRWLLFISQTQIQISESGRLKHLSEKQANPNTSPPQLGLIWATESKVSNEALRVVFGWQEAINEQQLALLKRNGMNHSIVDYSEEDNNAIEWETVEMLQRVCFDQDCNRSSNSGDNYNSDSHSVDNSSISNIGNNDNSNSRSSSRSGSHRSSSRRESTCAHRSVRPHAAILSGPISLINSGCPAHHNVCPSLSSESAQRIYHRMQRLQLRLALTVGEIQEHGCWLELRRANARIVQSHSAVQLGAMKELFIAYDNKYSYDSTSSQLIYRSQQSFSCIVPDCVEDSEESAWSGHLELDSRDCEWSPGHERQARKRRKQASKCNVVC